MLTTRAVVGVPISIRLDDDVCSQLEDEARRLGIGLGVFLRDLANKAARDVRRAQIRAASETVARHVSISSEARAMFDDWGTPNTDAG